MNIAIQPRTISRERVQTVNARELHGWLGSKRNFRDWIKDRIEKYGFTENEDFIKIPGAQNCAAGNAAPPIGGAGNRGASIEYHVSLDMAKELAMVERTTQGKKVRQYFIHAEKEFRKQSESRLNGEWRSARIEAATGYKAQSYFLRQTREAQGKSTETHHYTNEARLINWILSGQFKSLDRDGLTNFELRALERLQAHNSMRIIQEWSYQARKEELPQIFAAFKNSWRERIAGSHPMLALEGMPS